MPIRHKKIPAIPPQNRGIFLSHKTTSCDSSKDHIPCPSPSKSIHALLRTEHPFLRPMPLQSLLQSMPPSRHWKGLLLTSQNLHYQILCLSSVVSNLLSYIRLYLLSLFFYYTILKFMCGRDFITFKVIDYPITSSHVPKK